MRRIKVMKQNGAEYLIKFLLHMYPVRKWQGKQYKCIACKEDIQKEHMSNCVGLDACDRDLIKTIYRSTDTWTTLEKGQILEWSNFLKSKMKTIQC